MKVCDMCEKPARQKCRYVVALTKIDPGEHNNGKPFSINVTQYDFDLCVGCESAFKGKLKLFMEELVQA